ncbi:MAG: class I SAM-dependent methyltransferase [bacterium]
MPFYFSDKKRLLAVTNLAGLLAETLDLHISLRLWDGTIIPLGREVEPDYFISINHPGTMGSILRWPSPDNILRNYVNGNIDFVGGDLINFANTARQGVLKKEMRRRLRGLSKGYLFRQLLPLLFSPSTQTGVEHEFTEERTGRRQFRKNKDYIQFHYDVGNDFYSLFLDAEMQYSCGYFTDWNNTLAQAQHDKLEMICRKLCLEPGEKMLDIGCGWGGLICHAARYHGVKAHGITLSQAQHDFTREKITRLGLENLVTVELCDYMEADGTYDKVSSVGMFEHIGIDNFRRYFKKIRSLLRDRGIFLNHSIARRAKQVSRRKFRKLNTEKKLFQKYIFPGFELDSLGHTLVSMESSGFEIRDMENWREHYALTSRHWVQNLNARREEAVNLIGKERYRMWVLYLTGVSLAFTDGPLLIYQTVGVKRGSVKGVSGMPPTRSYLYR